MINPAQARPALDACRAHRADLSGPDAEAYQIRTQAQASAESIRLQGEAEATAIQARGQALQQNPLVIQLEQARKWNGALPTMMVPGGTMPMLDLGPVLSRQAAVRDETR